MYWEKKDTFAKREKAEEALTELKTCLNGMFCMARGLEMDSKEVEKGNV